MPDALPRIVIDTSVLVAAARSSRGASAAVVRAIPQRTFLPCLSVGLWVEWKAVLTRPEHLIPGRTADDALDALREMIGFCHLQDINYRWRPVLRDPDDDMVLELAVNAGAASIITFNVRDFDRSQTFGVRALTPAMFLRLQ